MRTELVTTATSEFTGLKRFTYRFSAIARDGKMRRGTNSPHFSPLSTAECDVQCEDWLTEGGAALARSALLSGETSDLIWDSGTTEAL